MKVNNSKGQLTYQIEIDRQQKNGFPIDCDQMMTGKMGVIYPTQALPVTYGDKINNLSSAALQFQPLAVPMLANMFVKQEHYYTPRNCVWGNWDNFISGGEDLQFDTPPPSASMKRIWEVLLYMFGDLLRYGVYFQKQVIEPGENAEEFYKVTMSFMPGVNYNIYDKIESTISILRSIGSANGISDIIQHYFINVIEDMREKLFMHQELDFVLFKHKYRLGVYDEQNLIDDGYMVSKEYTLPIDWEQSIDLVTFLQGNGTIDIQIDALKELVPTEWAIKFFAYLYKLIRPLCGIGSYLDMLHMNRVLPADFYYLIMVSLGRTISGVSDDELATPVEVNFASNDFASDLEMDCLNLRTVYLIWYNNYRDQLLEVDAPKPSLSDYVTVMELLNLLLPRHRCWEKDSYTTALDNPATADAVVPAYNQRTHNSLTMQSFEVHGAGEQELYRNDGTVHEIKFADGEKFRIPTGFISGLSDVDNSNSNTTNYYFSLHMLDAVKRAQKFLRKALFYGNRIQDFIMSTWGVSHLDARLRLPEILSTSTDIVQLTTLVNNTTVATDQSSTVAGDRAGYANGYDKGNGFSRYCEEAGVIMSFLTVMPQPTYPYGSDRQYYRMDRYDYPIPDFATLGMDAVFDSEIVSCPNKTLVNSALTAMPLVFGYQGRYYDSKFRQSTEHGELLTTQDMYTFGRKWNMYKENGRPKLNYEFVHCFPVTDMFVMDDNTEDIFRADVHHETTAELTLPYHSVYL